MNSTPRTEEYFDNESDYPMNQTTDSPPCNAVCIFYAVTNVIIIVLGVAGNGLVIWIAGFKVKKSVLSTWYLSLAMSDFIFCSFLPFRVVDIVKDEWIFGGFMCKFSYFILFLNMYSSIFLLVIISVDRCVVVTFPVWAQNKRTVRKASVVIMLAWIISAALSTPTAVFLDTCLNPFLYAFMGKDIKEHYYALWLKIENAVREEEDLNSMQGTAYTTSEENNNVAFSPCLIHLVTLVLASHAVLSNAAVCVQNLRANNLPSDASGKIPDVLVKVWCGGKYGSRTETVKGTHSPIWAKEFNFPSCRFGSTLC
ncbi:hypothetical protein AOLI_G00275690 [Acnodon oligacanthus]